jgi:hypothetical protein
MLIHKHLFCKHKACGKPTAVCKLCLFIPLAAATSACNPKAEAVPFHFAHQAILSQEINWSSPELQHLSPAARDFLERLLQRNPVMRPSASEALENPWIRDDAAASDVPLQVGWEELKGCWVVELTKQMEASVGAWVLVAVDSGKMGRVCQL